MKGSVRRRPPTPNAACLEKALVRMATVLAAAAGLMFLAAGAMTSDPMLMAGLTGPLVVAGFGVVQMVRGEEHIVPLLVVAALATVIQNRVIGAESLSHASTVALAIIGMTGVLFVKKHVALYITGYAVFLFASRMWWTDTDVATRLVSAFVVTISVVFGSTVLAWLRRELETRQERFEHLFQKAPVSLWEEDFSEVEAMLLELRDRGVTDLQIFFEEHPEELRRAYGLVNVLDVNDATVALTDAPSKDSLIGRLNPETMTRGALATFREVVEAVWHGESSVVSEVSAGLTLTGRTIEALFVWNAPIADGKRNLTRTTVAIVDITNQRQAERGLHEMLRSKDEFVATVSHELRTPLTAVVGLTEELRDHRERMSGDELDELLRIVADQSVEISKIVEDLLVAARADAGMLEVSLEDVAVEATVASVLKSHGLTGSIQVSSDETRTVVTADAGRLSQIFRNLFTNARRYGGEHIRVVIAEQGSTAVIEVRDDGDPLPHRTRDAIFDPYYRATPEAGVTASVGLGLTVSRRLAERMNGSLAYEHDGTETVFRLTLPLAKSSVAVPA